MTSGASMIAQRWLRHRTRTRVSSRRSAWRVELQRGHAASLKVSAFTMTSGVGMRRRRSLDRSRPVSRRGNSAARVTAMNVVAVRSDSSVCSVLI